LRSVVTHYRQSGAQIVSTDDREKSAVALDVILAGKLPISKWPLIGVLRSVASWFQQLENAGVSSVTTAMSDIAITSRWSARRLTVKNRGDFALALMLDATAQALD
jgi:hypothetical protein